MKKKDNIIYFRFGKATPLIYRLKKWGIPVLLLLLAVTVFIGFNIYTIAQESRQQQDIVEKVVAFLSDDPQISPQIGEFTLASEPYVSVFRSGRNIKSASCKLLIKSREGFHWVTCSLDADLNITQTVIDNAPGQ